MKKVLLIFVVIFVYACDGKEDREANCDTVLCATDEFVISLRDTSGMPLIGTEFVQDSFKLSSTNSTIYVKPILFGTEETILIPYAQIESDVRYDLELSATEIDPFRFIFSTEFGSCCTYSTMEELRYNGNEQSPEATRFYVLIRQ